MTAQNGVNTGLTRPGRVFPRPFTHGGDLPPSYEGGTSAGDKALMGGGGTHEGVIHLMRGPNFDRLYHKLKVLLIVKLQLHDAIYWLPFY